MWKLRGDIQGDGHHAPHNCCLLMGVFACRYLGACSNRLPLAAGSWQLVLGSPRDAYAGALVAGKLAWGRRAGLQLMTVVRPCCA
jgi:hypothetical protein